MPNLLKSFDDVMLSVKEIKANYRSRHSVKCRDCGKFISQKSIQESKSVFKFIPDSELGPEESYWLCEKCK